jgi:general secretion pathway protein D
MNQRIAGALLAGAVTCTWLGATRAQQIPSQNPPPRAQRQPAQAPPAQLSSRQPSTAPAGASASAGAQATTEPSTRNNNGANGHLTSQPGGGLMFNFKDASIDSVLDELSAVAGFIIVKEAKPVGRVTLVSKQPVTRDDAVALLNTVLKNIDPGFTAIQQDRILKIVTRDRAKRANIPVHSGADPSKIASTDELITQVIPLRAVQAAQLKTDLAPLINPEADFTANASSNSLIITDTSANIRRIVEIVAAMDTTEAGAVDYRVVKLDYADATATARLIDELFGDQAQAGRNQQNQSRLQGFFARFGGGGGGGPGGDRNRGGNGNDQKSTRQQVSVNASADDRTNTVVITGPPDTLTVIEKVIKELDANPSADETVFTYRLKNAQSLNVEAVVNTLFNGGTPTGRSTGASVQRTGIGGTSIRSGGMTGSSGRFGGGGGGLTGGLSGGGLGSSRFGGQTGNYGAGIGNVGLSAGAQQAASSLAGKVSIIADPDTNSLLVRTSPKNYEQVQAILAELDRPVGQVLIKALIAEVTHTNDLDVGAQFSVLNLRANGNGQSGGTNFGIGNLSSGLVVQMLEENLTATIRALETAGKLEVLSRPYILASDNQLANIKVGQFVPFPTNARVTDQGDTISDIEYEDIGIEVDVVPHINPEGLVILDVAPSITALTSSTIQISGGTNAPIFNNRSAESRVAVQNGHTIVIGGMMEDRNTDTVDKVPLLGDIPWIGQLFKRTRQTKSKTELLIFLTPHVALRPDLLPAMGQDELNGTRLMPNAIAPGAFNEHLKGLRRGATTAPTILVPPVVDPKKVEPRSKELKNATSQPVENGAASQPVGDSSR